MSAILETEAEKVCFDVKRAKEMSGLDVKEFADALDISLTYCYEILRGKYEPSPEIKAKIARLAKCHPSELVYLDPAH